MTSQWSILNEPNDLRDAVDITSATTGLPPAMVEKDLWVTFLLNHLFTDSSWKGHILFKGGTCLSKCYGIIDRFSEDVDLLLDWRVLGYGTDGPPIEQSRKKQENSNDLLHSKLKQFIDMKFVPELGKDISMVIERPFEVTADGTDVVFRYPSSFDTPYIRNEVVIEMGPRGRWGSPVGKMISSFVSKNIGGFDDRTDVICIPLEQAYYEKIQILHSSASRGKVPGRYSRHYYDVFMIHRRLGKIDFDFDSLDSNLEYNRRFYPGAGFGYDTMKRGSYRLMPTEGMIGPLREDYAHMQNMIFGDVPSFDDILSEIATVEEELNSRTG